MTNLGKKTNPILDKLPLEFSGGLAKLEKTSVVKYATVR